MEVSYGVTHYGGNCEGYSGYGTVFKITSAGILPSQDTTYNFCPGDQNPYGPLVQGSDGNLYGTTSGNCLVGSCGTIFKIDAAGKFTKLYSFCGGNLCGYNPTAGLLQATSGTFYGDLRI